MMMSFRLIPAGQRAQQKVGAMNEERVHLGLAGKHSQGQSKVPSTMVVSQEVSQEMLVWNCR